MKLLIDQAEDMERKKALLYEWSRVNELLDKQLYLTRLESKIEICISKSTIKTFSDRRNSTYAAYQSS